MTATVHFDPRAIERLTGLVRATGGESTTIHSPLDGQPLAAIPTSTPADVTAALARARVVQAAWAKTSVRARAALMLRFHDVLLDHLDDLCDVICLETGKPRKDAFDEVLHLALTARYLGRTLRRHLAPARRLGALPVFTSVQVNRVPEGVVAVISPWNYPLTMAFCDGLAAIGAGNAVVAKPDSQTMITALATLELFGEAGFPADVWQIVAGPGPEIGPPLIAGADHLCFTGSTGTGRLVGAQAAEKLAAVSLELGGKNPMIVLADADLDLAVDSAVRGCFSNSGQVCVSYERLYVARSIYPAFAAAFAERVRGLDLSVGTGWEPDVGTLISQAQLDKVSGHVEDARAKGATVLAGGRPRPDLAPYAFEPTVLEGVDDTMECFAHETFGPVVALYPFDSEAEAVRLANAGEEGLSAAVFSRDGRRARALAAGFRCGTITVNETFAIALASIDAPMGGMGISGVGRRQGPEGTLRFTEAQTIVSQWGLTLGGVPGVPREEWAALLLESLRWLRRLPRP